MLVETDALWYVYCPYTISKITCTMALEAVLKVRCCQKERSLVSCRCLAVPGDCTISCRMHDPRSALVPVMMAADARSSASPKTSWQPHLDVS